MVDRVTAASFIGREPELAELEAALADARDGRPRLAFVAGESGVGKTRLVAEFERRAEAIGSRSLGGECIELGEDELPYAPLVAAVRRLARADDPAFDALPDYARAELARLAPELGAATLPRLDDREGEAQRRLFDALLTLLEQLGEDEPVLFWLEDVHWADRSTRAFLAFLSATLRTERVLVVSTYRSDELHRRHPLRPLLNELERGPCARRIELRPFDRDELSAQLADILGNEPSEEVVGRLFARSEGNPLFTEELLASDLGGRGPLPPTLREALLTRVERLSPATRQALGALAVAGGADDATLAAALPLDSGELREALRESIAANLVRTGDDGRFGFRHALFREVVYDDLLPGERSELHLALARTLEQRAGSDDGAWLRTAVAHHFHQAEEQGEALRTAVIAAEQSERVHAHGEAAALLDRALKLWPRVPDAEAMLGFDLPALLARAARAHYLTGDDARGAALLADAIDGLEVEAERLRAARMIGDLANMQWSLGNAEQGRATLERALELVPEEPTEEGARLLIHQVRFRLLQGRFNEVEETSERALAMIDELGLEEMRPSVLNRLAPALFSLGETERGEAMLRESIALAQRSGNHDDLATAYVNFADALHISGRSEQALEVIGEAIPNFAGSDRSLLWLALLRAEVNFQLGNWDAAIAELPPTRGLARAITRVNANLREAELALGRGDTERARPLLEESWEILSPADEPQFIASVATMRAELALRERRIEEARAVIGEALDRILYCTEDSARIACVAATGLMVEASAAEHARDLGDGAAEDEAITRAQVQLSLVEASAEDQGGPMLESLLVDARAEAARASANPQAFALWRAAAESWRQLKRPYSEAYALWRAAEAAIAADDREGATAAAQSSRELAARLGAAWLVAELDSLAARARLPIAGDAESEETEASEPADPFGLTERERQVLSLVASGATNREIASELFIAEKTASVHVSRILGKLGVRSRTEAAAVAHRQGLAKTSQA